MPTVLEWPALCPFLSQSLSACYADGGLGGRVISWLSRPRDSPDRRAVYLAHPLLCCGVPACALPPQPGISVPPAQCSLFYCHGPQEAASALAASPMERSQEPEPDVHREVLCTLPAAAGAPAEPGGCVPGLQPPRVCRMPRVPVEDSRLEVYRVLRGQVSLARASAPAADPSSAVTALCKCA